MSVLIISVTVFKSEEFSLNEGGVPPSFSYFEKERIIRFSLFFFILPFNLLNFVWLNVSRPKSLIVWNLPMNFLDLSLQVSNLGWIGRGGFVVPYLISSLLDDISFKLPLNHWILIYNLYQCICARYFRTLFTCM